MALPGVTAAWSDGHKYIVNNVIGLYKAKDMLSLK